MTKVLKVEWTKRSLKNAKNIRNHLIDRFTEQEGKNFDNLLDNFERNVGAFPQLYPKSTRYPELRRAVLHKFTSAFYTIRANKIVVIAVQDNRQDEPGK